MLFTQAFIALVVAVGLAGAAPIEKRDDVEIAYSPAYAYQFNGGGAKREEKRDDVEIAYSPAYAYQFNGGGAKREE